MPRHEFCFFTLTSRIMLIIGERINASRRYIAQAIASRNASFIQNEAKAQAMAGADYIDVNAGTFGGEECEHLEWVIKTVQEVIDLPLSIDSPDPAVISAMMPLVRKTPMINSITLEPSRVEGILPLVAHYGTKIIALCQSEDSVADTAEAKILMAGQLVEKVAAAGIPREDLYIDPLVYPVGAGDIECHRADHGAIPGGSYHLRPDKRILRTSGQEARQSHFPRRSHCSRSGLRYLGPHGQAAFRNSQGRPHDRRQR
jgi:cobalamin-dependent methionine synthase I